MKQNLIAGAVALSSSAVVSRACLALKLIVAGNILGPAGFGSFAVAGVVVACGELLAQTGMKQALTQMAKPCGDDYTSVYIAGIARGIVVSVAIFLAATPLALFFGDPASESIIRAMSPLPLLGSIVSMGEIVLFRDLQVRRVALLAAISVIIDLIVTFSILTWSTSAWALVAGRIASVVAMVIGSYVLYPRAQSGRFIFARLVVIDRFGRWVFLSIFLSFLVTRGLEVGVGAVAGAELLAQFQMGLAFGCLATLEAAQVAGRIALPALSRMDRDPKLGQHSIKRAFTFAVVATSAVATLCALAGPVVANLVLSEGWAEATAIIPYLAVWGGTRAVGSIVTSHFQALGRPRTAVLSTLVVVGAIIPPFSFAAGNWGLEGIAALLGIGGLLALSVRLVVLARCAQTGPSFYLGVTGATMVVSMTAWWIGARSISLLSDSGLLVSAMAGVASAITVFAMGLAIQDRLTGFMLWPQLTSVGKTLLDIGRRYER